MRNAFVSWFCLLFLCATLLPSYALAEQPDPERIPEILAAQRSRLTSAKVFEPETSGIQTRSPAGPRLYKQTVTGTVLVLTKEGIFGSGVHVGKGLIATNWHVVQGHKDAYILFWRPGLHDLSGLGWKDYVLAHVLGTDRKRDLALLDIDPKEVPRNATIIKFARLSDVSVGQDVYAIGHPQGLFWSYTEGVVSQIRHNYVWKTKLRKHRASIVQTQTPIGPGSSGGPLFDQKGRLVGLNAATAAPGLHIAVAVDEVTSFVFKTISRHKKK